MRNTNINTNKICAGMASFLAFFGIGFSSVQGAAPAKQDLHAHRNSEWTLKEYEVIVRAVLEEWAELKNGSMANNDLANRLFRDQKIPGRTKKAIGVAIGNVRRVFDEDSNDILLLRQDFRALLGNRQQLKVDLHHVHLDSPDIPYYQSVIRYILKGKSNKKIAKKLRRRLKLEQPLEEIKAKVARIRASLENNPQQARRLRLTLVATDQEKETLLNEHFEIVHQKVREKGRDKTSIYTRTLNEKTSDCSDTRKLWRTDEEINVILALSPYYSPTEGVKWSTIPKDALPIKRNLTAIRCCSERLTRASMGIFGVDQWQFIQNHRDPTSPLDQEDQNRNILMTPPNPGDFCGEKGQQALENFNADEEKMPYIEIIELEAKNTEPQRPNLTTGSRGLTTGSRGSRSKHLNDSSQSRRFLWRERTTSSRKF
ncbi:MAG: hypothetical protein LBF34_03525 [Puniceicoccales bacterium]|jgi:hypothetical protein|nr:hypothetical protein [Puniceicoccales bacterium]